MGCPFLWYVCACWKVETCAKGDQTATKGDKKHSVLFDAGPEGDAWERNVKRLRPDLSCVEVVQLSHWHRDHSGALSD